MKASYKNYKLNFKKPSGTSRGVLLQKETFFLSIEDNGRQGYGECALFRGLSVDDVPDYEDKLTWVCKNINLGKVQLVNSLTAYPSLQFGIEQAFLSLEGETPFHLYPSDFTRQKKTIPINGLVWMGDEAFMLAQIEEKIKHGFSCIKMKIGAIDFDKEFALLQRIRSRYSASEIELRVDANGAFSATEALGKLEKLATLDLHSIEQPIKAGQMAQMQLLCKDTPLPIALDEELIGVFGVTNKEKLLQTIQPQYIILKPSLVGGFSGSEEWISLAEKYNIGWWITSALESNIGLNAIAQWTASLQSTMYQGLGTGALFTNNIGSPLFVKNGALGYGTQQWNFKV